MSRYNVLWRKQTQRKNKTWDGDGVLAVVNDEGIVRDDSGNFLARVKNCSKVIHNGVFRGGSYEFELDGDEPIDEPSAAVPATRAVSAPLRKAPPMRSVGLLKRPKLATKSVSELLSTPARTSVPPRRNTQSLHDAAAPGALVMPPPPNADSSAVRNVVVDPVLAENLRPHQKEGVKFMYECVMGFRDYDGHGVLLADSMGLGKTLQTITLVWTLLKQSPVAGDPPVARKVLICCPVTLVMNWKKEFRKWLGPNRVSILALNGSSNNDKQNIQGFANTNVYHVMIIGYEKMLTVADDVGGIKFDLVVCDEGHRLKSGSNKALKVLESLDIKRRVLLSGTPIQNDLTEFYNVANFVNPGVLGDFKSFQRRYMRPILRAREANCTNGAVLEQGEAASRELIEVTKKFTLRRTIEEITKFLPRRSDYVLFAPPTKLQIRLFESLQKTAQFSKILNAAPANDSLQLITTFRKICNSPALLTEDAMFAGLCGVDELREELGSKVRSAKIILLVKLLKGIYKLKQEKVVVVSNFTQTLDVLEKLMNVLELPFTRLDGATPANLRDKIVSDFNKASWDMSFVFLLSAKSGGMGLNLVGASRLVLFDNDWNPAVDLQAMARIHRDGQTRPVHVYRLLTAGCIDEKIFQRQLIKTSLSDKFLDDSTDSNENFFDTTDLKDLFSVSQVNSNTHMLLDCQCPGDGRELEYAEPAKIKRELSFISALNYQDPNIDGEKRKQQIKRCLMDYRHYDPATGARTGDPVIDSIIDSQEPGKPAISYIFMKN
ncbi:hypothetical protein KL906_004715 [Ogataea polymorpha]|uniref:DNA-dependent ATPase n=1 Tax=Ogataea polymorpha TaxID=460523 RepID=A0A1B7SHP9_9ASCO|nr:uncharacterized protein OGAPODRAFT_16665 [Ogataea polymorpha]KAG7877655.1 hypothetical protein KL937_004525 [Ogataea polymorpha]KAG7906262.1 hypothetical protein KL906_004715 [Ogataea polymorpha]KAG7914197.1 hypothetical protein KL927_004848 [Ogataea polymorpha]KAG7932204.1 hypothetical protein KL904_004629 [Ogataea polymorpha]KAH3678618.1 hypothetical protein OGATHE_000168 [Ogataea polymorpha]